MNSQRCHNAGVHVPEPCVKGGLSAPYVCATKAAGLLFYALLLGAYSVASGQQQAVGNVTDLEEWLRTSDSSSRIYNLQAAVYNLATALVLNGSAGSLQLNGAGSGLTTLRCVEPNTSAVLLTNGSMMLNGLTIEGCAPAVVIRPGPPAAVNTNAPTISFTDCVFRRNRGAQPQPSAAQRNSYPMAPSCISALDPAQGLTLLLQDTAFEDNGLQEGTGSDQEPGPWNSSTSAPFQPITPIVRSPIGVRCTTNNTMCRTTVERTTFIRNVGVLASALHQHCHLANCTLALRDVQASGNLALAARNGLVPRVGVMPSDSDSGVLLDAATFSVVAYSLGPLPVSESRTAPRMMVSVERSNFSTAPNNSALWAAHVPTLDSPNIREIGSLNLTIVGSNFTEGSRVVWAKGGVNRVLLTNCRFEGISGGAAMIFNQTSRHINMTDLQVTNNNIVDSSDPLLLVNIALGERLPLLLGSSTIPSTTNSISPLGIMPARCTRCSFMHNQVNSTAGLAWYSDSTYAPKASDRTASSNMKLYLTDCIISDNINYGLRQPPGFTGSRLYSQLAFAPILRCDACKEPVVENLTAYNNVGNVLVYTATVPGGTKISGGSSFTNNTVPPTFLGAAVATFYLLTEFPESFTGLGGLEVESSLFANNTGATGGAVWAVSGTVYTMTNCTFYNNSETLGSLFDANRISADPLMIGGGALALSLPARIGGIAGLGISSSKFKPASGDQLTLTVQRCNFTRNRAISRGGALAARGASIAMYDNHFEGNVAGVNLSAWQIPSILDGRRDKSNGGGALYVDETAVTVYIRNNTFLRNVAEGHGGAIRAARCWDVQLESSRFDSNYATDTGGAAALMSSGSGTDVTPTRSFVRNCTFSRNQAGMYFRPPANGTDTISQPWQQCRTLQGGPSNSMDNRNRRGSYYSLEAAVAAAGQACYVGGADPEGLGGALYVDSSKLRIECATFISNTAVVGAGIFASGAGGRVLLAPSCTAPADGTLTTNAPHAIAFIGNQAVVGAAVAVAGGVTFSAGVPEMEAARQASLAGGNARVQARSPQLLSAELRAASINMSTPVLFQSNIAVSGGALSLSAAATIILQKVVVIGNTAARINFTEVQGVADVLGAYGCGLASGGGLCIAGAPTLSLMHVLDSNISSNSADFGAGAFITARYAATTCPDPRGRRCFAAVLDSVVFTNNTARQAGGVAYWTHEGLLQVARCPTNSTPRTPEPMPALPLGTELSGSLLQPCPEWRNAGNTAEGHGPLLTSTPHSLSGPAEVKLLGGEGSSSSTTAATVAVTRYHTSNVDLRVNVSVLDYYGQVCVSEMQHDLFVRADNKKTVGDAVAVVRHGVASFVLRLRSGSSLEAINFTSIYSDDVVTRQLNNTQAITKVFLRSCLLNEERLDEDATECSPCMPSFFRWTPEKLLTADRQNTFTNIANRCVPCPEHADCSHTIENVTRALDPWVKQPLLDVLLPQPLPPSAVPDAPAFDLKAFLTVVDEQLGPAVNLGDVEQPGQPDSAEDQEERQNGSIPSPSPVSAGAMSPSGSAPSPVSSLLRGVAVPQDGYWHSNLHSDQMVECLNAAACTSEDRQLSLASLQAVAAIAFAIHRVQAAVASNFSSDAVNLTAYLDATRPLRGAYQAAQCARGYTGPLCGVCEEGFGAREVGQCVECPASEYNSTYYALSTLFTLAMLAWVIWADWQSLRDHIMVAPFVRCEALRRSMRERDMFMNSFLEVSQRADSAVGVSNAGLVTNGAPGSAPRMPPPMQSPSHSGGNESTPRYAAVAEVNGSTGNTARAATVCAPSPLGPGPVAESRESRNGPVTQGSLQHRITIGAPAPTPAAMESVWYSRPPSRVGHVHAGGADGDNDSNVGSVPRSNGCRSMDDQDLAETYQSAYSALVKVLMSYLQVLALFREIDLSVTEQVGGYLRGVDQVTAFPGSLVALDCSLPEVPGASKAVLRTVLTVLAPLYVSLGFLILTCGPLAVWRLVAAALACMGCNGCHKQPTSLGISFAGAARAGSVLVGLYGKTQVKFKMVLQLVGLTVMNAMFFFYPTVVTALLSIFSCKIIDGPLDGGDQLADPGVLAEEAVLLTSENGYWLQDLNQECYEGRHAGLAYGLGIPGIVLLAAGWPLVVSALSVAVTRRRNKPPVGLSALNGCLDGLFRKPLEPYYHEYRDNWCGWEFAISMRKLLASVVIVCASKLGAGVQLLLLMLVCSVALALQVSARPYRAVPTWDDRLDVPPAGPKDAASMYSRGPTNDGTGNVRGTGETTMNRRFDYTGRRNQVFWQQLYNRPVYDIVNGMESLSLVALLLTLYVGLYMVYTDGGAETLSVLIAITNVVMLAALLAAIAHLGRRALMQEWRITQQDLCAYGCCPRPAAPIPMNHFEADQQPHLNGGSRGDPGGMSGRQPTVNSIASIGRAGNGTSRGFWALQRHLEETENTSEQHTEQEPVPWWRQGVFRGGKDAWRWARRSFVALALLCLSWMFAFVAS